MNPWLGVGLLASVVAIAYVLGYYWVNTIVIGRIKHSRKKRL